MYSQYVYCWIHDIHSWWLILLSEITDYCLKILYQTIIQISSPNHYFNSFFYKVDQLQSSMTFQKDLVHICIVFVFVFFVFSFGFEERSKRRNKIPFLNKETWRFILSGPKYLSQFFIKLCFSTLYNNNFCNVLNEFIMINTK